MGGDGDNKKKVRHNKTEATIHTMNTKRFLLMVSSSSRGYLSKTSVICRCHQSSSFDTFNKIKTLYKEGKRVDAMDEYFKNHNPFAASFLITRQDKADMALQIYQVAKNNSSLDFFVIRSLISFLEKRNEHHMMLDTVFDDSMVEISRMQAKDIAKIEAANWGSILKSLCMREAKKKMR